jgi:hypothetical protein
VSERQHAASGEEEGVLVGVELERYLEGRDDGLVGRANGVERRATRRGRRRGIGVSACLFDRVSFWGSFETSSHS